MAHAWGCIVIVIVEDTYIYALFPLPEDFLVMYKLMYILCVLTVIHQYVNWL